MNKMRAKVTLISKNIVCWEKKLPAVSIFLKEVRDSLNSDGDRFLNEIRKLFDRMS